MMERINKVVKWRNIEALLMEYYEAGKSEEGADAYPPLMLLKCMLLQKCLWPVCYNRRGYDPELENQTCPVECVAKNIQIN
jgi:transposase, IS5 family